MVGRVAGGGGKPPAAPMLVVGRSPPASASGRLPHTHEVPVRHVEGQRLVGGRGNPAVGGQPHAPPLLDSTPSTLQRAPHPGRGLKPDAPPCEEVAMPGWGRCCWKTVPLDLAGVFLGTPEQLCGVGWEAGAVLGIATGAVNPPVGRPAPASPLPPTPGKTPQGKSNPSACVLACGAQSGVKLFSSP